MAWLMNNANVEEPPVVATDARVMPADLPTARRNSPPPMPSSPWMRTTFGSFTLQPHQVAASRLFCTTGLPGLLLYYKVGSGKTVAAIAAAENLAIREKRQRNVVVVLPATLADNFQKEMRAALTAEERKRYKVLSYHAVHRLSYAAQVRLGREAVLIVDEVQNYRTPDNKKLGHKSMLDSIMVVAGVAHKRLLLSGTPVMNFPMDIGATLALIDPTTADRVLKVYNRRENGNYVPLGPTFARRYGKFATRNVSELDGFLRCTSLFYEPPRSVIEAHYPTKTEYVVSVPMSIQQTLRCYEFALQKPGVTSLREFLDGMEDPDKKMDIAFLTKPRMACTAYIVRPTGRPDKYFHTKIDEIVKRTVLEVGRGGKCVVFSSFKEKSLHRIGTLLRERGVPFHTYDGDVKRTGGVRHRMVTDYNTGRVKVLLISDAGKEGLDLKNTTQLHVVEPAWNEEKIQQVIGRVVRYKSHTGDRRHVDVFRYVATNNPAAPKPQTTVQSVLFDNSADEVLQVTTDTKKTHNRIFLQRLIAISDRNMRECMPRETANNAGTSENWRGLLDKLEARGDTLAAKKKLYQRLALMTHPNKGGNEERFKNVQNAWNRVRRRYNNV